MGLFRYILGGEGRRNLRRLDRLADEVLSKESKYAAMTDAELRASTDNFKERLKNGETLDDILTEAFAAVREAAFRTLGMKHYKVQRQNARCNTSRLPQRTYGARGAHSNRERLSCRKRRRVDGQSL